MVWLQYVPSSTNTDVDVVYESVLVAFKGVIFSDCKIPFRAHSLGSDQTYHTISTVLYLQQA